MSNRHSPKILSNKYNVRDFLCLFIRRFAIKVEQHGANISTEHVTSKLFTWKTTTNFSSFEKSSQSTVKACNLNSALKSFDLDSIPSKLFIECPQYIHPFLTDLLNYFLASGIFRQWFKSDFVKPILKMRYLVHNDLRNCWRVSNLSFIAEIQ